MTLVRAAQAHTLCLQRTGTGAAAVRGTLIRLFDRLRRAGIRQFVAESLELAAVAAERAGAVERAARYLGARDAVRVERAEPGPALPALAALVDDVRVPASAPPSGSRRSRRSPRPPRARRPGTSWRTCGSTCIPPTEPERRGPGRRVRGGAGGATARPSRQPCDAAACTPPRPRGSGRRPRLGDRRAGPVMPGLLGCRHARYRSRPRQRPADVLRGPRPGRRHSRPAAQRRVHDHRGLRPVAARSRREPSRHRRRPAGPRPHRRRRPPALLRGHGRRRRGAPRTPRHPAGRRRRLQHGRRRGHPGRDPPPAARPHAGADLGRVPQRRHAARAARDDPHDHTGDVRRIAVRSHVQGRRAAPGPRSPSWS